MLLVPGAASPRSKQGGIFISSATKSRRCRLAVRVSSRKFSRKSVRASATVDDSSTLPKRFEEDYYSVLGLEPDATVEDIKKAYYACMKECHPDLIGDHSGATNFCMFINEVYEVLSDPDQRMIYDEINGYALTAQNPFSSDTCRKDRVFVDEFSCIGCKNCANTAPKIFTIDDETGRARAYSQPSTDPKPAQVAIESCPVDCIHWVSAAQLALLEDEMRRVELVNVGIMLSGMGYQSDVFGQASTRWKKTQAKARIRARERMMSRDNSKKSSSAPWWQVLWNQTTGTTNPAEREKRAKDSINRAAAAARRWRDYSRKGAYDRSVQLLEMNKQDSDENSS